MWRRPCWPGNVFRGLNSQAIRPDRPQFRSEQLKILIKYQLLHVQWAVSLFKAEMNPSGKIPGGREKSFESFRPDEAVPRVCRCPLLRNNDFTLLCHVDEPITCFHYAAPCYARIGDKGKMHRTPC
jgi:hypothetical protein